MNLCSAPIAAAVLADYWIAALPKSEEEAVEEHLLACDLCGARLHEIIAMAEGVRALAREGSLRMIVSDAFLKRAAQEGLRIQRYDLAPGSAVQCTVTATDNLLIGRMAADFSRAKRVDLGFYDDRGVEQFRLPDIPVASGATGVNYQESITFAKAAPTFTTIGRLIGIDDAGNEYPLAEYTLNHTRSLPGPGAW